MVLEDNLHLPSDEELAHKEIPLTYNMLYNSAMWLGKYCDNQCKEFMLCRQEEHDPRRCLKQGHAVTDCGIDFFKKVKKTCRDEMEWYVMCMDNSGTEPKQKYCRREQAIFDTCMYESGFERARFGHFQMLRVHDSERPRPKSYVPIFEGGVEKYDHADPEKHKPGPQGLQNRSMWQTWRGAHWWPR